MDAIEKIIKESNKSFGEDAIGFANEMDIDIDRVPTGALTLDWATGGGMPLGRIIELYGPYSSGKTLIALRVIAEAQKMDLPCFFVDAELSFEEKHAAQAGVDLSKLVLVQTLQGEKIFDLARKAVSQLPSGVFVVDSVAAIVPEYEEENETNKQTMALTARLMSKGLRILNGVNKPNKGWSIIFVNQVREKVGVVYGSPETTPGGRALGFFSSLRINVRSGERFYDKNVRIGQEIKFKVEKSKVCVPHREGEFKYFYQDGVDQIDDTISLALKLGVMDQAGAWYTFAGERFQGRAAIEAKAKEDPEFFEQISKALQEKWSSQEDR